MTWLEFKTSVEAQGVKDDDLVYLMEWEEGFHPRAERRTGADGMECVGIECGDDPDDDLDDEAADDVEDIV